MGTGTQVCGSGECASCSSGGILLLATIKLEESGTV